MGATEFIHGKRIEACIIFMYEIGWIFNDIHGDYESSRYGITHKYIIIIIYICMVGYQSPAMPTKNKVSQTNQALVL